MSEPLTIYECPECGLFYDPRRFPGPPRCAGRARIHMPVVSVAVRVFREEDVRPLYDAADAVTDNSAGPEERVALLMAWDAFPAPAEWK